MLQSILKRIVCKNLQTFSNAQCLTISDDILRKDINRVKLIGTVLVDQFKDSRGHKFMNVKTMDADGKNEQIHHLHTTVPFEYAAGQRVFVDGRLNSKEIVTFENKRLFTPIVYAFRIYPLNSMANDNTKLKDLNSVQLLASICADIIKERDHNLIQAITHHRYKTLQEEEHGSNLHTIFIFDKNLREFVYHRLEKNDRFLMNGSLSSMHTDDNGNKSQSGCIIAQSIQRIIIR